MKNFKFVLLILILITTTQISVSIPKFVDSKNKVPQDPIYKKTILIPQDNIINVTFKNNIMCSNVSPADNIEVILSEDFIFKGKVIAEEGSIITGKFVKKIATKDNTCKVRVKFTNIIKTNGINIPISAVFLEENSTGYISSLNNGQIFKENNADIIIKQPITYIPQK